MLNMIRYISIFLLLIVINTFSQSNYWVYFDDDYNLTTTITKIQKAGGTYRHSSSWLNAATFVLNTTQKNEIEKLPYVKSITPVRQLKANHVSADVATLNKQIEQIKGDCLLQRGLDGKGIKVGIIDAGFSNADSSHYFHHLFSKGLVKKYKDYIDPDSTDFFESKTTGDTHGASVWKFIAGKDTNNHMVLGLAQGATFYLARTEIADKEQKIEEDKWIEAIEWMHKQGVRVVNSSLGYADKFDDKKENYEVTEMDGNTAAISKAAQIATEEKGMLLVISAGNLGHTAWKVVSAPADAKGVISVGATHITEWKKATYSSIGPSYNPFLKPNVSSLSSNGTSFSSPVIAGLAACLWQRDTSLTNKQLKKIIEQSSHLYPYGNNYLGYGVPNAKKALAIIDKDIKALMKRPQYKTVKKDKLVIPLAHEGELNIIGFYKLDKHIVKKQVSLSLKEGQKKLNHQDNKIHITLTKKAKHINLQINNKSEDIIYTSFSINNKDVYEIKWSKKQ